MERQLRTEKRSDRSSSWHTVESIVGQKSDERRLSWTGRVSKIQGSEQESKPQQDVEQSEEFDLVDC